VLGAVHAVRAGILGEGVLRVVAAMLEQRRAPAIGSDDPAGRVGRHLRQLAASDPSVVLRPTWLELLRTLDAATRRDLLARALAWVLREHVAGRFTIGAVADAALALANEGVRLEEGDVGVLTPHLARLGDARGAAGLRLLTGILESVASPRAAARLEEELLRSAPERAGDLVRLTRLAAALDVVERVRDDEAVAAWRAMLRRAATSGGASLPPESERALREFLGVRDGAALGRLLDRLPSLTSGNGERTSHGRIR
jgi:hypothetical protein